MKTGLLVLQNTSKTAIVAGDGAFKWTGSNVQVSNGSDWLNVSGLGLDANSIALSKIVKASANTVLGNNTGSLADVVEIPVTSLGFTLLSSATATTARTALSLGTIATQDANNVAITGGTATLSSVVIGSLLTGFISSSITPTTDTSLFLRCDNSAGKSEILFSLGIDDNQAGLNLTYNSGQARHELKAYATAQATNPLFLHKMPTRFDNRVGVAAVNSAIGGILELAYANNFEVISNNSRWIVKSENDTSLPVFRISSVNSGGTVVDAITVSEAGTVTLVDPLDVVSGGTGASTAADARTNLSAQQQSAVLDSLVTNFSSATNGQVLSKSGSSLVYITPAVYVTEDDVYNIATALAIALG